MENSEFLSPHQCFIVYEESTKKVAISLRNLLSARNLKCSTWDEAHFRDNESRMSNFNRILFLSDKYASEYLASPMIPAKELTEFATYKREGRVASISLKKDIDFKGVLRTANEVTDSIKESILKFFDRSKKCEKPTAKDVALVLDAYQYNQVQSLDIVEDSTPIAGLESSGGAAKIVLSGTLGAAIGGVAYPIVLPALISLYGYSWYKSAQSEKDLKLAFLFTAAREFEMKYFDDFVNAE